MKLIAALLFCTLVIRSIGHSKEPRLTVHEWGTFTIVAGSDGTAIPWWTTQHRGPAELPEFVKLNPFGAKLGSAFTMRMETPVLYFYPDAPMRATVRADYPGGKITEWFPSAVTPGKQGVEAAPAGSNPAGPISGGQATWQIDLLPPEHAAKELLPVVNERGRHYEHARHVPDAWLVKSATENGPDEVEKFVFYRGAGDGAFLSQIAFSSNGNLEATQYFGPAAETMFVVRVTPDGMGWTKASGLTGTVEDKPREALPLNIPDQVQPLVLARTALGAALVSELVGGGLTDAEARAMVATWSDAWMGEPGLRVLYVLPRSWVDAVLPLKITPKPERLERVFVARVEQITPDQEKQLQEVLTGNLPQRTRMETVSKLGLGRFLSAGFERAITLHQWKLRKDAAQLTADLLEAAQP